MSGQTVESVLRAFDILRELNRSRVTSLKDLHAATGLPKATLVRLLKTLGEAGYVTNDRRQGGYQVTSNVKALSCGYHRDPLVIEAARPWSIEFTRKYQWPIAVATLEERNVIVRFSTIIDSPNSPFHGTINLRLDLLTRALGRAYLAFCPIAEREMLLDLLDIHERVERQDALDMLGRVRRAGFSLRDLMSEPRSSNTIAMPVMLDDKVLATVGVTYFNSAFSVEQAVAKFCEPLHELSLRIASGCEQFQADVADTCRVRSDHQIAT
ncbi:helix-turn-helix domain-containing protein [Rhizobium sp. CFBP 8752]|uniref:helix-turn-helix domain-containing protein n=1 Tax=Rhizobium/Agrobacterium group TaxID=227290 RepID=UPI0013AF971D|nr:helix-turn-helix domain-containing protein [Rhizobium sp. CFBP 8752]MBD8664724.1 helix-turn-helix domain-containing protein [Rhizobium sp. CFBP 8752]